MQREQRRMRKLQMFLLDLLYPNFCPCCGKILNWWEYLCTACRSELHELEKEFCPRCGNLQIECTCETEPIYDRAVVLAVYADAAKRGVLSLKKAESLSFGWYCAENLSKRILQDATLQSYDCVVPVPMAKTKKRKRFCNPAAVLAKEISRLTRIPLRTDLLWDDGTGKQQHTLAAKERTDNLSQFHIYTTDLTGYRVLLCDDVLTTGSTMNCCAGLLKSQGVAEVAAISMTSTVLERSGKDEI